MSASDARPVVVDAVDEGRIAITVKRTGRITLHQSSARFCMSTDMTPGTARETAAALVKAADVAETAIAGSTKGGRES